MKQALLDKKLKWEQLPEAFKNDVDFAISLCTKNASLLGFSLCREIFDRFPSIRLVQSYWCKLIDSFNEEKYAKLLSDFAPAGFFSRQDIMLEICSKYAAVFELVDDSLLDDRDFLESILRRNVDVLRFFSHESQILHTDLIMQAIPNIDKSEKPGLTDVYLTAKAIYPPFWEERDFVMHWVVSGHGLPEHAMRDEVLRACMKDREIRLALAVHGNLFHWSRWHEDIQFMLEVVEHYPEAYNKARDEAATDPWVMTVAFAALPELADKEMRRLHFDGQDDDI